MFGDWLCMPEIDAWRSVVSDTKVIVQANADGDEDYLPASNDIFSLSVSLESTSSTSMEAILCIIKTASGYQ